MQIHHPGVEKEKRAILIHYSFIKKESGPMQYNILVLRGKAGLFSDCPCTEKENRTTAIYSIL
jgi:hypothetical protein